MNPVLGNHPEHPNISVGAGFSGKLQYQVLKSTVKTNIMDSMCRPWIQPWPSDWQDTV